MKSSSAEILLLLHLIFTVKKKMPRSTNPYPSKALAVLCKVGLECIQNGKSCTVLIDQQTWQTGESLIVPTYLLE